MVRVILSTLIMIYSASLLGDPVAFSPVPGKRYSSGVYEGKVTPEGKVYDSKGIYQGRFRTSKNGKKIKSYDRNGRYIRTIHR